MKLQDSKFKVLLEYSLNRHQSGGFLVGDVVIIRPAALKHQDINSRGQSYIDILESKIKNKELMRVSAIKSIRQDTPGRPAGSGVSDFFIDIYEELAPGSFGQVFTFPAEVLEIQEYGINLPPAAGLRKKHKTSKSEELKSSSLAKANTKIKNSNNWPNLPGGRKPQKY